MGWIRKTRTGSSLRTGLRRPWFRATVSRSDYATGGHFPLNPPESAREEDSKVEKQSFIFIGTEIVQQEYF